MELMETKQSKFNAAIFQMKRIHELQELINQCNVNLIAWNPDYNCYNFELKHRCLGSLFSEARPKLSEELKKNGDLYRYGIKQFMEKFNPINQIKALGSKKQTTIIQKESWEILQKELQKYEDIIREFLEAANLQSPNMEEEAMF